MSIGHRDQRIEIYQYTDTGADGLISTEYVLRYTRWGRIEAPTGREVTLGAQAEQVVNAVLAVAWETAIGEDDVVRTLSDGLIYRVVAVLPRRQLHERQALLVRADDALPDISNARAAIGAPAGTAAGLVASSAGTVA